MWHEISVNVADLLFAVSEAMDVANPTLADHHLRTAYMAWQMGRAAGLDPTALERLFVAALLHDIGALSPEEKLAMHDFENCRPGPHCIRGEKLFQGAFWLAPAAPIVRWHHTPIDEHRANGRSLADPEVLSAQILYLAEQIERAIRRDTFILHQTNEVLHFARAIPAGVVCPDVVSLFDSAAGNDDFWLTLAGQGLAVRLKMEGPLSAAIVVDYATAHSLAGVLKDMTDFRSRFTVTHSAGVAVCARGIAESLGFAEKDLQQIELAGCLHDIGKLVVPNAILCKPGPLDPAEYAFIRQHPHFTHRILAGVAGFEQVAEWAAFHHERLDGSGYCRGLKAGDLDLGTRVVAVADVATAIAERRPYRQPGDESAVLSALRNMADDQLLDANVVTAFSDGVAHIMSATRMAQEEDELRFAATEALWAET